MAKPSPYIYRLIQLGEILEGGLLIFSICFFSFWKMVEKKDSHVPRKDVVYNKTTTVCEKPKKKKSKSI
jgi:hypothetical protein